MQGWSINAFADESGVDTYYRKRFVDACTVNKGSNPGSEQEA